MDYVVRFLKLSETSPAWSWNIICARADTIIEPPEMKIRPITNGRESNQPIKQMQTVQDTT